MKWKRGTAALAVALALCAAGVWGLALQRVMAAQNRTIQRPPAHLLDKAYPAGTRKVLEAAPELILYSISPRPWEVGPGRESFHDYLVLGKTVVRGEEKRRALDALYDGVVNHADIGLACFEPRHGIRARDPKTNKIVDLLICFSCHNCYIWAKGIDDKPFVAFGPALERNLNDLFRKRGIKIAP